MLTEWLEDSENVSFLNEFSEHAGIDLIEHGTVSDAETIKATEIAQPLIVASSLLSFNALKKALPEINFFGVAGHSVGEIAAAAASGILSSKDAAELVGVRSRAMAEAAAKVETGMTALVGTITDEIRNAITDLGLYEANFNSETQLVVGGSKENLGKLPDAELAGIRVIPLQVAGAFHTPFMESAVAAVQEKIATINADNPEINIWTNFDGSLVATGTEYLNYLATQVAHVVRWDQTTSGIATAAPELIIEFLPGGTLVGLLKRAISGVPTVAIKGMNDIEKVKEAI
ncbi:MAG: ACP S-malonyltransferase [Microbacteriaceae bacterium]|nr:ACP S-malonyltransferase [Microbacteriaceae bacterium]